MSPSPGVHSAKSDTPQIGAITFLVDMGNGTLRPDSVVIIQNALKALASEFLFVCPDRMRAGTAEVCRFTSTQTLNSRFRDQLRALGVPESEAAAVTLLVDADLRSPDHHAFDIETEDAAGTPSSSERIWRVAPRNPGEQKLELTVTLGARIASGGYVQGIPTVLFHSVSVFGHENLINEYGRAIVGGLAAVALSWMAWILWRNT